MFKCIFILLLYIIHLIFWCVSRKCERKIDCTKKKGKIRNGVDMKKEGYWWTISGNWRSDGLGNSYHLFIYWIFPHSPSYSVSFTCYQLRLLLFFLLFRARLVRYLGDLYIFKLFFKYDFNVWFKFWMRI